MAPGMAMAIPQGVVMVLAMLAVLLVQTLRTDAAGVDNSARVEFTTPTTSERGFHEDSVDEFLDEPTRRVLATATRYVSYGALNANRSPCSSAGRSYYSSCKSTGTVLPYSRGCSQITRCARG